MVTEQSIPLAGSVRMALDLQGAFICFYLTDSEIRSVELKGVLSYNQNGFPIKGLFDGNLICPDQAYSLYLSASTQAFEEEILLKGVLSSVEEKPEGMELSFLLLDVTASYLELLQTPKAIGYADR